jgi:hypothetical protein
MKRRSVIFTGSAEGGDVSVKLDTIDNLGEFVQVGSLRLKKQWKRPGLRCRRLIMLGCLSCLLWRGSCAPALAPNRRTPGTGLDRWRRRRRPGLLKAGAAFPPLLPTPRREPPPHSPRPRSIRPPTPPKVHSKDRERSMAVAKALGMAEFIPRSYIEQARPYTPLPALPRAPT